MCPGLGVSRFVQNLHIGSTTVMCINEGYTHGDGHVLFTCNEFTPLIRLNKKSRGHELILAVPV